MPKIKDLGINGVVAANDPIQPPASPAPPPCRPQPSGAPPPDPPNPCPPPRHLSSYAVAQLRQQLKDTIQNQFMS